MKVEHMYPQETVENELNDVEQFKTMISQYSMPDASHLVEQDYVFFNVQQMYGISYYQQLKVTKQHMMNDKDITRNTILKSVVIISKIPIFGSILQKLQAGSQAYFQQNQLQNYEIVNNIFTSIQNNINNTINHIDNSELYINQCLRQMVFNFQSQIFLLVKCILLRKNIIIYSQRSSNVSNFIVSLLSLFQGYSSHSFVNKNTKIHERFLQQFGFPFQVFDQDYQLIMLFNINDIDRFETLKGYLIGTTNQFIKNHSKSNSHLVVDLDLNKVSINQDKVDKSFNKIVQQTDFEKNLVKNINVKKTVNSYKHQEENISWEGSDDQIRQLFHEYFQNLVEDLVLLMHAVIRLSKKIKEFNSEHTKIHDYDSESDQSSDFEDMVEKITNTHYSKFYQKEKHHCKQKLKTIKKYNKGFISYLLTQQSFLKQFFKIDYEKIVNKNNNNFVIYFQENGEIYLGKYLENKKQDKGIWIMNGHVYQSEFKQDQLNGTTKMISLKNNTFFIGNYLENQKHGRGEDNNEQFYYNGQFKDDKFYGNGLLINYDKNIEYEGSFVNGRFQGSGHFKAKSINENYVGEFNDGKFEGKGQYTYYNQDIFNGSYRNNMKHGKGVLWNQKKEIMEATWVYDQIQGLIKYTDIAENVYYLHYRDGRFDKTQYMTIQFKNDQMFKGTYEDFISTKESYPQISSKVFN